MTMAKISIFITKQLKQKAADKKLEQRFAKEFKDTCKTLLNPVMLKRRPCRLQTADCADCADRAD